MQYIFLKQLKQLFLNITIWFSYINLSFKRPTVLVLELTSICNAQCSMCNKENSSRTKEHMDYSLFKRIVDDAQLSKIDKIQLSFYGEPLLYPQLIDAILYIRQKIPSAFITLNTNGILLTPKFTQELLKTKIDSIAISIDGNNKEEYEKIRINLQWDVLQKNIKNLRKIIDKNRYSTKIGIMGLNIKDIIIDEKEYIDRWGAYADTIFVRNENELNDEKKEFLLHKLMPCNKIFSQFVIMTSGDVTMCAYDWEGEEVYGNIKDSKLLELWKTPTLQRKRYLHLLGMKKQLDLCNNCSYRVDDLFKKSNLL